METTLAVVGAICAAVGFLAGRVRSGKPKVVDLSGTRAGVLQDEIRRILSRIDPEDGVTPQEILFAILAELGGK